MSSRCTNCGATVDVGPEVLATTCAFCDSPLVAVPDGAVPPEAVVPFRVPRQGASQAIRRYLDGHWFAPAAVRKAARPTSLHSAMLPLWSWQARAHSTYQARIGIHWTRTETYTTTENGKTVTKTRTVRETEWFGLEGPHGMAWRDHLVSAGTGLTEAESNALEPYDLGAAVPWDPSRVAGHVAEAATIDAETARATAEAEVRSRVHRDIAQDFLPGDVASGVSVHTEVTLSQPRLVLVPVWIAVVRGGEHVLRVLVNGQTGEVIGEVPTDWARVAMAVGAVLLVVGLFVAGAMWLEGAL